MTHQKRRTETEKKIVDALCAQLSESGFREIGINAIARRAGVSKELIYRYFGSVEAILERMMRERDFWPSVRLLNQISGEGDKQTPVTNMILRQGQFLRENDVLREIRNWELVDKNEVTAKLADERERASLQFLRDHDIDPEDARAPQIALLFAGILYLTLRSNTANSFMGISLDSKEGWDRLNDAVTRSVQQIFNGGAKDMTPGAAPVPDRGKCRN
jgi:AcrR family transcriptional regulator